MCYTWMVWVGTCFVNWIDGKHIPGIKNAQQKDPCLSYLRKTSKTGNLPIVFQPTLTVNQPHWPLISLFHILRKPLVANCLWESSKLWPSKNGNKVMWHTNSHTFHDASWTPPNPPTKNTKHIYTTTVLTDNRQPQCPPPHVSSCKVASFVCQ